MSLLSSKKIPHHVDRRIHRGIRFLFWRDIVNEYVLSRMTFALGMAVFGFMFISSQYRYFELERQNTLYASVLEQVAYEHTQDERAIVHVKMRVEEGKDKAEVVARISELDASVAELVPQRSEEVEFWSHGTNVMTVVRSNMPQQPARAFMNLERDNHVHVFRYEPEDCNSQTDTITSSGCSMRQGLTPEQKTYRKVFDGVHSIDADYQELLSIHTKPFQTLDLEPMSFDREEEKSIVFTALVQENLKREYVYEKTSLKLMSIHTFLQLEGQWYEMSAMYYEEKERLQPEVLEEIFDPSRYPLIQTELIQLT